MAENFTEFVMGLAQDPQALNAFKSRPEAVMKAAGLTGAERSILLSKDPTLVHQAIVKDLGQLMPGDLRAADTDTIVVIVIAIP
jgi:hypothetical protein